MKQTDCLSHAPFYRRFSIVPFSLKVVFPASLFSRLMDNPPPDEDLAGLNQPCSTYYS